MKVLSIAGSDSNGGAGISIGGNSSNMSMKSRLISRSRSLWWVLFLCEHHSQENRSDHRSQIMKTVTLATAAMMLTTTLAMGAEHAHDKGYFEEMSKRFERVMRIGVDVRGNQDDVNGGIGDKKDMGYEIAFGVEKKVDDFRFGTRIMNTIYNYGDKTYYQGGSETLSTNYGLEMSMSRFYKATKYFKPYLGAGFGINKSKLSNSNTGKLEHYAPTLHIMAGISGEVIVGIGYYVQVKRRFADNFSLNNTEVDGVNGTMTTAGVSYQF
jgi:hypothetical protein